MKILPVSILCVWGALAGCSSGEDNEVIRREGEAPVVGFSGEDVEMNEAMRQARATLDEYERRLTNPPDSQSYLGLKARFEGNGAIEHMWISDVKIAPQGYSGTLANEPVEIHSLSAGQAVSITRDAVSDWLAIDDGRLVGGYTVRVVRNRVPEAERAEFDEFNGFRIDD